MSEPSVHHRAGCQRPPLQQSAFPGGVRHECPGCGKYTTVRAAASEPSPTSPPVVVAVSGYRCREHPGESVTWKGHGCTRCPKIRKSKRTATLPSDDYIEMEY